MVTGPVPHGRDTDPFKDMTDEQVLQRAIYALRRVNSAPIASIERSVQWGVYEQAKAELDMRLYAHVLRKVTERREQQ